MIEQETETVCAFRFNFVVAGWDLVAVFKIARMDHVTCKKIIHCLSLTIIRCRQATNNIGCGCADSLCDLINTRCAVHHYCGNRWCCHGNREYVMRLGVMLLASKVAKMHLHLRLVVNGFFNSLYGTDKKSKLMCPEKENSV